MPDYPVNLGGFVEQAVVDQFAENIHSVRYRNKTFSLVPTGVKSEGGFSAAYEFENPETKERYYVKFNEIHEESSGEVNPLMKVIQLFRNEVLAEPDPLKRLNYLPTPEILTDDPEKFNLEFVRAFDRSRFRVQIQTSGIGTHCETQLPESLSGRLAIGFEFAKLLRACAKNKIAYVDIKPLEHLFWTEDESRLRITLIDWGNARLNAPVFALSEDIRKFCLFLPELIYGRKMLELINKGKFEYPIQRENDRILIRLLGRLSCTTNVAPLSQKYAALLGDQLSGGLNEIRLQNRCVEVWDEILAILDEALEESRTTVDYVVSWESLKKDAEALIRKENEFLMGKDFQKSLEARLISLSSYKAWLIPAIRFLQTWYEKVDLVPQRDFDLCVDAIITGNSSELTERFEKLTTLVTEKLNKNTSNPELTGLLQENLARIENVILAWQIVQGLESGEITDEAFQMNYNTSALRVVDPFLADAYKKIMKRVRENGASRPPVSGEIEKMAPTTGIPAAATPDLPLFEQQAIVPRRGPDITPADISDISERVIALLTAFEGFGVSAERWNFGFIQDLNSVLQAVNQVNAVAEERELSPILESMLKDVSSWTGKLGPDHAVVSDETLHSINWLTTVPEGILQSNIIRKIESIGVGGKIHEELDACMKALAEAGNVTSQESFTRIGDKITRIKGLRKKLDTENLFALRKMIEDGDFLTATNQIEAHYLENPALYDHLREEILARQKDREDRKSLALINTLLTDLSGNSEYPETGQLLANPNNLPMLKQKVTEFRRRNIQLFDLQDEMVRTKSMVQENRKAMFGVKQLNGVILFLLGLVLALSIGLLVVMLIKNFSLEQNIARLESNLSGFQQTYEAYQNATDLPTVTPLPATVTPVPPTAEPSPVPTEISIVVPPDTTVDENLSPADAHLKALLGQKIVFDLNGNVDLFADEALSQDRKLGTVINYAQNLSGTLVGYTDTVVNIVSPFNIGRSQISISTYLNVARSTNIRQYSEVPGATSPIFISQIEMVLAEPATACTDGGQEYCHGMISFWVERNKIETTIK